MYVQELILKKCFQKKSTTILTKKHTVPISVLYYCIYKYTAPAILFIILQYNMKAIITKP